MDTGAVGAVSGLGLLVLLGCVVCLYDKCVDRPRELLPLYHRAPQARVTRLFSGAA
jgi:hypothetical protein